MNFSLVGVLLVKIFILFYFKTKVQSDCHLKSLCWLLLVIVHVMST